MSEEITSAVIVDTGSGYIKAGFAHSDFPSIYSRSVLAKMKFPSDDLEKNKRLFGEEALKAYEKDPANVELVTPVKRGMVQDWDEMEHLWQNIYLSKLNTNSAKHPILVSVYADEQKLYKEKLAQMFFENFNVPGFYSSIHSLFSIYATGKTGGLVVDSGYGLTTVVPIIDGYNRGYAHIMSELAGSDIDGYLKKLISAKNSFEVAGSELEKIKKTRLYISDGYEEEVGKFSSGAKDGITYDLPDGNKLELKEEMIQAPEILFNPRVAGLRKPGLTDLVMGCLEKIEGEKRPDLVGNVVLSGGNTKMDNFVNRLSREMTFRLPNSNKVKVYSSNERQFLTWSGAAVVSGLSTFQTMWITQTEYDENGPSIVHRKCL